tara:strand:+ start:236292 stop:237497 length:1206 start_codon:yes stop_codon:yes gene_type:complete
MILNVKGRLGSIRCFGIILGLVVHSNSNAGEWSGYSAAEYRYFQHPSLNVEPSQQQVSVVMSPEFYHQWDDGKQSLIIAPFLRIDNEDAERTHIDLREARWLIAEENWELRLGIGKVYWGVTESQHLVDVINQTDLVENPDNEDKLGQPMINLSLFQEWGTVDLFVLPYFRERTFAGKKGRLRSQLVVDTNNASYESSSETHHIDFAVRWSHSLGDWDVGLSHFYGTNREPLLMPNQQFTALNPYYELMNQTGLEVQRTTGAWLLKLESIRRETTTETFIAATGGVEYTFYDVFESGLDVGLISEYLFDDRDDELATPFEDDVMFGTRITWNNVQSTELLVGLIQDLDSSDATWSIEASRRLGNRWKLSVEGRLFKFNQTDNALYQVRNDDYFQVELARYF